MRGFAPQPHKPLKRLDRNFVILEMTAAFSNRAKRALKVFVQLFSKSWRIPKAEPLGGIFKGGSP